MNIRIVFSKISFLLLVALLLALTSVWLSTEFTQLSYKVRTLGREVAKQENLIAKLEVERDNLLSPAQLELLARHYNLTQAKSGQIRSLPFAREKADTEKAKSWFQQ